MFDLKVSKRSENALRCCVFIDSYHYITKLTQQLHKANLSYEITFRSPQETQTKWGVFKLNILHTLTHSDVELLDNCINLLNLQVMHAAARSARARFNEFLSNSLTNFLIS